MTPRDHPLFKKNPLSSRATISSGEVSIPYHVYDGSCVFIGGTADFDAVNRLLVGEKLNLLRTSDGFACMGIWLGIFDDANLGPHHELQFSIFVAEREERIVSHPKLGVLTALVMRPDVKMLCHGLWNSTATVVAYNREVLSLDARLSDSCIVRDASGGLTFDVKAAGSGVPCLSGRLAATRRASLRAVWSLAGSTGFARLWRFNRQPWMSVRVVNPCGFGLAENLDAKTYTVCDTNNLRYFDEAKDTLKISDTRYADVGFRPQFVQQMDGFKFVYMKPGVRE